MVIFYRFNRFWFVTNDEHITTSGCNLKTSQPYLGLKYTSPFD